MEIILNTEPKVSPAVPLPQPVPTPPKPAPSAEELQKSASDLHKAMGWSEPEPAAATPEPIPAPQLVPAAPQPAAPAPAPVAVVPPAPAAAEPTTEELIERTAARTAALMRPEPVVEPAAAAAAFEMLPEDAEDHRVLTFLASKNPKWRGKAEEFEAYVKKHYEYQDKWLAAHPDMPFDTEANEHADWYAKNYPNIEKKELEDGRLQMKIDERAEQIYEEKTAPEREAKKAAKAWHDALPTTEANINRRVVAMVEVARPELAKLLRDANGVPNLSNEAITMVDAADPIAKEIFDEISEQRLVPMLTELEKVAIPGLNYRLDPEGNRIHAQIDTYRKQAETDLQQLPSEQQLRNGRQWVTIDRMNQMKTAIIDGSGSQDDKRQNLDNLRARYWTVNVDDVADLITDDLAREAQRKIEKRDGTARRKYSNGPPQPQPAPQPQPQPATPAPAPAGGKPRPPSVSGGSDLVTGANRNQPGPKSFGESAVEVHFK